MAPTFFLQQVVKQQNHKQMTKACLAYKLWIQITRFHHPGVENLL
jgi:hypothetical protein